MRKREGIVRKQQRWLRITPTRLHKCCCRVFVCVWLLLRTDGTMLPAPCALSAQHTCSRFRTSTRRTDANAAAIPTQPNYHYLRDKIGLLRLLHHTYTNKRGNVNTTKKNGDDNSLGGRCVWGQICKNPLRTTIQLIHTLT